MCNVRERIINTSAYVGNFVHAQNFWTGSTYDNVQQRMPTYGSVSVTYEKRIPGVCNVHQRSS